MRMSDFINGISSLWSYRPTKIAVAGAAGYAAPHVIASLMRSGSSNPVAFAFALTAMTAVAIQQYSKPSGGPKVGGAEPATVEHTEASGASEEKGAAGFTEAQKVHARSAFEKMVKLQRLSGVVAALQAHRTSQAEIDATPVVRPSSRASTEYDSAYEAKSGGLPGHKRGKSPLLAALRHADIITASQEEDLRGSRDLGSPLSAGSSPTLSR